MTPITRYDGGGGVMGKIYSLFSAFLKSLMKGMMPHECLHCNSNDAPVSFEMAEGENWGSSANAKNGIETEIEVLDWGNGEFVTSPTVHPCDYAALRRSCF
jgi:hypothetical protein